MELSSFFASRSRVRRIFQLRTRVHRELRRPGGTTVSHSVYVRQKFGRFDQVLSTSGFEFSGPFPPPPLSSSLGTPRARQIYTVFLYLKKKKINAGTHGTVHGQTC